MRKVLIMLPNNPGDVLMATPALRAVKKGGAAVHFLVDADCLDLVRHNPHIDKLHVLPRRDIKALLNGPDFDKGMDGLRSLVRELQAEKFDRVVNLFQGEATALISTILNVRDFSGPRLSRKGRLKLKNDTAALIYAIPFARAYCPAHAADLYGLLAGARPDGLPTELVLSDGDKAFAEVLLKESGLSAEKLVVLHPCCAHPKKEWPHSHFSALLDTLVKAGYSVALTGSAREKERVDALIAASASKQGVNLCGRASFLQSAAIIARARALVTGDTVAMHMGAALGTRTLAIFAPTSPLETGPYAAGCVVYRAPCLCLGHYSGPCLLDRSCTGTVTPEAVFADIEGHKPALEKSVVRCESRFDPANGLIEYTGNNDAGHRPVARLVILALSGGELPEKARASRREIETLEKFMSLANDTINILSQMKSLPKNDEHFMPLLRRHGRNEREINLLTGIGAYLSAYLRLKNNSISNDSFSKIADAMIENSHRLLMGIDKIMERLVPESGPARKADITALILADDFSDEQCDLYQGTLGPALTETISIPKTAAALNAAVRKTKGRLLLLLDPALEPNFCFADELSVALARDPHSAAVTPKILAVDETLHASTGAGLSGLGRFSPEAVQYREMTDMEPLGLLMEKEVFLKAGGLDETQTWSEAWKALYSKWRASGLRLLYCPDAEVYHTGG
ncbi:MAG: glycosyltransferase family 9 protein [Fibrobacterota bacterium]